MIEALARWAGAPNDRISGRRQRAYEPINAVAAEKGLPAEEPLRQTVRTWLP